MTCTDKYLFFFVSYFQSGASINANWSVGWLMALNREQMPRHGLALFDRHHSPQWIKWEGGVRNVRPPDLWVTWWIGTVVGILKNYFSFWIFCTLAAIWTYRKKALLFLPDQEIFEVKNCQWRNDERAVLRYFVLFLLAGNLFIDGLLCLLAAVTFHQSRWGWINRFFLRSLSR